MLDVSPMSSTDVLPNGVGPGPAEVAYEVGEGMAQASRSPMQFLRTVALVSETYLSYVLIALWDSGIYEYVRRNGSIAIEHAAHELSLNPEILRSLLDYLVGRGLMRPSGEAYVLTDRGITHWNYVTRGVLTAHVGGYSALFTHLGPLLRGEIELSDPLLDRDGRLVAIGAGYTLLGSGTVGWMLRIIRDLGARCVLDLGCGAGAFLNSLAHEWPDGSGIGVDMDAEAIRAATQNAARFGVTDRVKFYCKRLSAEPMSLDPGLLERVEVLTAMYVLHEFGGSGGPERISEVLGWLVKQFPGRTLLMAEGTPADPIEQCAKPPRTYAQLDYSFFHPLSRQGPLRTPDEWRDIVTAAGAQLVDRIPGFNLVPEWISVYVVRL